MPNYNYRCSDYSATITIVAGGGTLQSLYATVVQLNIDCNLLAVEMNNARSVQGHATTDKRDYNGLSSKFPQ